ncbi:MAG: glycosyltransferase family 39 protein [Candidatus Altiarchaeota archaeon]
MKKPSVSDERIVTSIFIFTALVFYATSAGMNDSNSGSHYALTKAIAEDQSYIIDEYVGYTGTIDAAKVGETWYSDRPPGNAFIASLFYLSGKVSSAIVSMPRFDMSWDAGNPGAFTVILLPVISASASVALLYLIVRRLGGSVHAGAITALTLAFCTITWEYAQLLHSHALSQALMMAAAYLALTIRDSRKDEGKFMALCLITGYAAIVEYPNILLTIPLAWYLKTTGKIKTGKKRLSDPILQKAAVIFAAPLIILAAYNTANFGSPVKTGYSYNYHFGWARSMTDTFSNPMWEGLMGLLVDSDRIQGGLLKTAPIVLLALACWPQFHSKKRGEAVLLGSMFLIHLLFYAKHQTYWGGGAENTRYLLTVTPFILLPAYIWLDKYSLGFMENKTRIIGALAYAILAYYSASYVVWDIMHYPGHEPFETVPLMSPGDVAYNIRVVFRNMWNLPFMLGLMGLSYSAVSLRINRPLGFRRMERGHRDKLVALAVASLLLLAFRPDLSGGKSFIRWEARMGGGEWSRVDMPVEVQGPGVMEVRASVQIPKGGSLSGTITAVECVENVNVNNIVKLAAECGGCEHCNGFNYDLTKVVTPGLNSILFRVKSNRSVVSFRLE